MLVVPILETSGGVGMLLISSFLEVAWGMSCGLLTANIPLKLASTFTVKPDCSFVLGVCLMTTLRFIPVATMCLIS